VNFLTFIFSLLLILSFSTFATLEKQLGDRRIRTSFLGHLKANRRILSKCETAAYKTFRAVPKTSPEKAKETTPNPIERPLINPACARLNLWPLIQEGREEHPLLYEAAAKLFKTFYGAVLFEDKPRFEYRFLDLFLKKSRQALQKQSPFALEKLSLDDPAFQGLYYKMLKGTKERSVENKIGYPSLLDSISIEESPSKICLSHAHPDQIAVFFGFKAADKLFKELHQQQPPLLTAEFIEKVCSECHVVMVDPKIFALFEFGRPAHDHKSKTTFIEEDKDTHISLRKNVYFPRS
jgi:hypothetical protein